MPRRRRSTSRPTRATSASFSRSSCSAPASSSRTPSRRPGRWGRATRVAEVEVGDSNTNVDRDTAIQIGRLNLRLMLERDAGEGYATIGVARVVERRADNKLVLDTQYIPPMMHAQGHQILDGYVRELCGLLHQRGEALAARLSQPGRGGVAEIADFLLLRGGQPLPAGVHAAAAALGAAPGSPLCRLPEPGRRPRHLPREAPPAAVPRIPARRPADAASAP